MVDVPRSDQERHLRAIIPEWLTRPPEHELLRRQQIADEAALDARIQGVERRVLWDTLRVGALFGGGTQLLFTGFAPLPLAAALVLGLVLSWFVHRIGEGMFVWMIAGLLLGCAATVWMSGAFALLVAPCLAAMIGGVVGVVRDPSYRV